MGSIQFYTDSLCTKPSTLATGPANGDCTQFATYNATHYGSFKVILLEQTCAVTIYNGDVPFCSSLNQSIVALDECSTDQTVNQFSVDCENVSSASSLPASTALIVGVGVGLASSTTSTQSTTQTTTGSASGVTTTVYMNGTTGVTTNASSDSGISTGAKAGIGVGVAFLVLGLLGLFVFFTLRKRKNSDRPVEADGSAEIKEGRMPPPGYSNSRHELESEAKLVAELSDIREIKPVEMVGDSHWPPPQELDAETPKVTNQLKN